MTIAIIIIVVISIPFIYFKNKISKKDTEKYKVDFLNHLKTENFYFTGKVQNIKLIDHGGGIICLEQITTNKAIGYELKLDDNYAVIVEGVNSIKFIGDLYFDDESNKNSDELNLGDSISYNFGNNGRIRAYRKNKLLYDRSAYIYKVHWNEKLLYDQCD